MNKRQSLPFIALLISFVFWTYLQPESKLSEHINFQPNYVANNVISDHYDHLGFNDYRILSDKMTSFAEADVSTFEQPKIIIYKKNNSSDEITIWQLSSQKGTLEAQNKLDLFGNVLVENLSHDQIVQTMKSEKITIMLDSKEITSESKVTWTGPQMQQQGIGMWASLVTEEMTLHSNITAVYFHEPN